MAEEKSAPKKEKSPPKPPPPTAAKPPPREGGAGKKAGKGAQGRRRQGARRGRGGRQGRRQPQEARRPARPPPRAAKPVEMIGGVAKQPTAEDLLKEELGAIKVRKAKGSKNVISGVANVLASFNNTIVSITDLKGQVIAWSSAGKCNFRGSRKSTAYAAQIIAQDAARNAMSHGLKDIVIRVSGPGLGRDSAIRALQAIGLEITSIVDVTPIPHNGCRPRKRRRV